ncbi:MULTISPECIES: formate dehydrogenase accessory sulfurtransferase FdhD [unclassified Pseudomonas]|uniref:formate dehydrogenase accessory sulfurtransferase FdhD n=1 Tax=unclassified Pseudomonas TaxID=196821 RepID=UPI000D702186|nr:MULTISPECIES: formate dehydrogenase accessory sulfurtransferase FdhD [unclassified Pseudomonas]PWU28367.1 formate dehydrogenase accessory sulfurtransferase FdhD [Pseudomonas sp. RW407]
MVLIDETRTDISDINAPPDPAQAYSYVELGENWIIGEAVLARETALAISYNGISQAVMMVSPGNMEDFVRGFSLTNEIVTSLDEIHDIKVSRSGEAYLAQVELANRAFWALKGRRRQLAGTSGCGICGVEALDQALPALTPLRFAPLPEASLLEGLRERIGVAQTAARGSGALHAALYLDGQGEVRLCREDIGRHNALDKLIGAMAQARVDPAEGFVVVTSRCGLELVHKAVRARIGTLVSLSAPTALTVEWARRNQLNLIHVPHRSLPRLYSPAP